jgi:hypothetical protein
MKLKESIEEDSYSIISDIMVDLIEFRQYGPRKAAAKLHGFVDLFLDEYADLAIEDISQFDLRDDKQPKETYKDIAELMISLNEELGDVFEAAEIVEGHIDSILTTYEELFGDYHDAVEKDYT